MMLECEYGRAPKVAEVISSRMENLVFNAANSRNGLIFGFYAANVAEWTRVLQWAKELDGVKSAKVYLVDEVTYVFDWLEREAERRAASRGS